MTYNRFIEPAMLVLMIMGLLALFLNRLHMKRGIVGVRSIQFLAVVFVLPMTVILSEEGKLDSEAVAFVIGTVVGYILQFVPGDD
jgi:hypothetical protein